MEHQSQADRLKPLRMLVNDSSKDKGSRTEFRLRTPRVHTLPEAKPGEVYGI